MVAMIDSCRISRRWKLWGLAAAGVLLVNGLISLAQDIPLPSDDYQPRLKKRKIPDPLPTQPNLSPALSIPVDTLGFGPPGPTYLGRHYALLSLDFLDENRLLFSFRAPGLLHRDAGDEASNERRQMHAVVVRLPDGKVESKTIWTVPDLERYVWPLSDGRFLLRDRDGLQIGDSTLETKPFLKVSGELLSLQIDPSQRVLVTRSMGSSAATQNTATAGSGSNGSTPNQASQVILRVVDLASGHVIETQAIRAPTELPVTSEGYLTIAHDKIDQWSLKLNPFAGSTRVLGHLESTCLPDSFPVSDHEILVTGCNPAHNRKITALTASGQKMWETEIPDPVVLPLLRISPDGSRIARETIVLNNGVKPGSQTLWVKAVKGQVVRVFDAASGKIVLETPVSPTLDGGGNFALSPSGRRIAVLKGGAIAVFDLPPVAP
jgi:outer membrane protein assembly factor BamB